MLKIIIEKVSRSENFQLPKYHSENSSGLDIVADIKYPVNLKQNEIFLFTTNYLLKKKVKMRFGFQSQLKILITAGPTQEKIDPIRYVSNNSSGKQGYALAEEFLKHGAHVTLISGPTNINKPDVNKLSLIHISEPTRR